MKAPVPIPKKRTDPGADLPSLYILAGSALSPRR
jgi:hypothetical protein